MSDLQKQIAGLSPEKQELLLRLIQEQKGARATTAIPRRQGETNVFSASFAQQRLWFLDQLETGTPYYNICRAFALHGPLDVEALEQSLNEIVLRHEVLRTTFTVIDTQLMQVVAPFVPVRLAMLQREQATDDEMKEWIRQKALAPFHLSQGPLWRVTLLRHSAEKHILIFTMHHIVFDGWSLTLFLRELSLFYESYPGEKAAALPELPIQYGDYALWQREWLQGERLQKQQEYWKQQLHNLPEILALPFDRPRPAIQTFRGAVHAFMLPKQISEVLKELSRREGVTLFMTLLAVLKVLLYRYTGQEDLVIGSPIANRTRREVEALIGFFVNTLVLRTKLSASCTFREILKRVHRTTIEAYAHQDLPFEQLVELLQPARTLSYSPLYQVSFDFQSAPPPPLKLGNITGEWIDFERGIAKFDLTLFMVDTEQGLQGLLEYNTDLFEAVTIRRMATHFQVLAEGLVANPEQPIAGAPLLTAEETQQILVTWNNTRTAYPRTLCVQQLVEAQAARTPEAIAVVCNDEQLTYQELNRRANQLAHYLRQLGVKAGDLVGVYLERSCELLVSLLGVLKAGAAYVPLDPFYPAERLVYMLKDAQVAALLTTERIGARVLQENGQINGLVILDHENMPALLCEQPSTDLVCTTIPQNLAYVIYTSGSTGRPKGVQITHRGLCNLIFWHQQAFAVTSQDRATQLASLSFDAAVWELWPYLTAGSTIALVEEEVRNTPSALSRWLERYAITIMFLPTPLAERFLDDNESMPTSLRFLLTGGDRLQRVLQRDTPFTLVNNYGPTENTVVATSGDVTVQPVSFASPGIGRPISNTRIYVVDRQIQPVPAGVTGELYIGGESLGQGYLNMPDLTAERFVPDPFGEQPGGRLYRTGDLARYQSDGSLEFIGRNDAQVKLRGFRIELGEIEEVLNQHPAVQENVVLLREDARGEKRLVAYVVARTAQTALAPGLRAFLQARLPDYMVPAQLLFLEQLPLTTNGKVDRRALPEPDRDRSSLEENFIAPRNPLEEEIAQIWCAVLGLEKVGIYDNFFELGGHSLRATKVISRIRTVFQVDLPVRNLFEVPTIGQLAARIEKALKANEISSLPPFQRVTRDRPYPLSFTQERLWFMDQLEPGKATYNIPSALRLQGPLALSALEQSLQEIVNRHESLRTSFAAGADGPVQVIVPHLRLPFALTDLSDLPTAVREQKAQELTEDEAQRPFDLQQAPMFRVHLLRLAFDEHILLLTTHHIVADGWSIEILLRELGQIYEAFLKGLPSPLPSLPFQYADYTVWQRTWLQGEVLETQVAFWKHYLAEAPTALEGLTSRPGRPRPPTPSYRGAWHFFAFSQDLVARMRKLSQQEDTTLFMLLLAAFETLLFHYTEQDDFLLGTPIAGRTHTEIEGLIGFFTNMLVLRANLTDNPDFRELLKRTRESTLGAYVHQDLPFAKLVEVLQPRRDPSRNPLFQVMFIFNNEGLRQAPQFSHLNMSVSQVSSGTEKFDLTLAIIETETGLQGALEYSTDLFDAQAIAHMAEHFHTLLEQIVTSPDQRVLAFSLLTEAERRALLDQRFARKASLPRSLLPERIEAQGSEIQIYILNAHLQPVPMGIVGELYLGDEDQVLAPDGRLTLAAERFLSHPFSIEPGARLYRTGHRARYLPDGSLELLGRVASEVRINGLRVQPELVEVTLLELPEIQDAVVVPWKDSRGMQRLVAHLVPAAAHTLNPGMLRSRLRVLLPEYMIPMHFSIVESIPRASGGEVQFSALPLPREESHTPLEAAHTPQSALERSILQIWQEVLQRGNVSLYDNFFDLGGHSLLLLQIHQKLSAYLSQPVAVVDLFNYPTVSALADYLSTQQQSTRTTILSGQNRASARKEAMERRKKTRIRS